MTVETTGNKSGPYVLDGSTTSFHRDFPIMHASHIRVVRILNGVEQELTSGYTQTGIGSDEGEVILSSPLSGGLLMLVRSVPNIQASDYSNQAAVRPEQIERDLDLLEMQVQDLREEVARAPKLPVDSAAAATFPAPVPGGLIIGRADGLGWETGPDVGDVAGAQAAAEAAIAAAAQAALYEGIWLDTVATVVADAVVSGLGIEVQTELAESSGIATGDGIVVDAHLRTDRADVFAAGDVAEYPDRILGRRRVEHVDNAEQMGRQAGRNLAGAGEEYTHTPYYYSVVFGTRYEAVGTLDGSLETVEDWVEPLERGVVYYLDDDRVVGVLLWNIDDRTDAARAVLTEDGPVDRDALIGRIREEAS